MRVLGPGRYLDGFVRHFSSRYTPSDPKFIILDPQNIKKNCLGFRVWEGARGGPEEAGIEKVDRRLQPNAKVPFILQFHEAFLRVGITNYQFLQRIIMAGSVDASRDLSRALYQHRQDPSEASSVWGMYTHMQKHVLRNHASPC